MHFLLHCDKNVNILHNTGTGRRQLSKDRASAAKASDNSLVSLIDMLNSTKATEMSKATLTIASKNYGSWSLRGWLLCKMANLDFEEHGRLR